MRVLILALTLSACARADKQLADTTVIKPDTVQQDTVCVEKKVDSLPCRY